MLSELFSHPFAVLLPVMLACAGVGAGVWSSASARAANRALRITWLGLASAASGVACWAAAYVAISTHAPQIALGFDPVVVAFDFLLMAGGFAIAFATASYSGGLDGLAASGLVAGLTLAAGQYLALIGIAPAGAVHWDQVHVELSVIAVIVASVLAFMAMGRSTRLLRIGGGIALMTLAVLLAQRLSLYALSLAEGPHRALQASDLAPSVLQILISGFYGLTVFMVAGAAVLHIKSKTGALAQLKEAIEALPAGLAFYDKDDRLVLWNSKYYEISGAARELLTPGRTFRELIAADLKGKNYIEAMGREEQWLDERMALRAVGKGAQEQAQSDGRWLRVEDRRTADGGVVSICADITDLKAREDSFKLLFAGNPVAMLIMKHRTLEFIDANQAACDLYGYSREEFLTKSVFDLAAPEERDALTAGMTLPRNEYQGERIWKHTRADGSEIHVLPYGRIIPYGEESAFMAAYIDVTSQVRANEALEQARAAADAANRSKSEFLANMSHEIRTPLNGVIGVADVLASTSLAREQVEMLDVIRSSGRTLEALLADVLDLARIESGHVRFEEIPFHLGDAVRHAAAVCELRAREKGVGFLVEVDPAADVPVVSDPVRIKQVVTNLVSNAVKFTERGEVRISLKRDARGVFTLAVRDTGCGFDPTKKEQIFGRFQQADGSITRKYGGTGLGLAICKQIAELMGGDLDCDSTPGQGSVFTLSAVLPLHHDDAEEPPAASAASARHKAKTMAPAVAEAPEEEPDNDGALRVLLADDHPTNRKVVELILASAGVELVQVENGAEAVEAFSGQGFDLVLMDMQMPVQDGLSATRAIRELEQKAGRARTPVIMLTANALPEHVAAAAAAGADRHLSKPITAAALLASIQEAVTEAGGGAESAAVA